MDIAVDTNVLMAALIRDSKARSMLCSDNLSLFAPEKILAETLAHREEILGKSGISEADFSALMAFLMSRVIVVPEGEYAHAFTEASALVAHAEDTPFMALALHMKIPLWSTLESGAQLSFA